MEAEMSNPKYLERIADIPHCIIGGRVFFERAADRDRAARLVNLPESPVKMVPVRTGPPRGVHAKFHLKGTACHVTNVSTWSEHVRERAYDFTAFTRTRIDERCKECQREYFANRKTRR
jgi:hypothetical protein